MASSNRQDSANIATAPATGPDAGIFQPGPGSELGVVFLDAPLAGALAIHPVQQAQLFGARFPASAAVASLQGGNLILDFANGGAVVLHGYLDALRAGKPASLVFQDGVFYEPPLGPGLAAALGSDLGVASGPEAQTPEPSPGQAGGSRAYEDNFGALAAGLQASGALGTPAPTPAAAGTAFGTGPGPGGDAATPPPSAADLFASITTQGQAPAAVVNQAPSDLSLAPSAVDELPLIGLPVGFASVTDPDPGDSHSFALLDNAGGRFVIDAASGLVRTAAVLDFETAASHDIIVRAIDSGGATIDRSFTITVNDLNEIVGGPGADNIVGTAATDVIDGQGGDDVINAGAGDDLVFGGIGRDTLNGDAGDDFLFGEAENDILNGGAGADSLFGGSGNDVLQIDAQDILIDGGAGIDRAEVQGAAGVSLNLTTSSIELAFGGAGNDSFDATGSNVGVRMDGGGGNDTLIGGNLGDRLRGEAGDDTLRGGPGDDLLDGGLGNDSLTGLGGNDVFAVNLSFAGGQFTAEGNDTVTDFAPGDVLSFRGVIDDNGDTFIDLADLSGHVAVASAGGTATLTFDGGGMVTLQNLSGGPFNSLNDFAAAGLTVEALP